jgi:putative ABC transport system permease protein
MFRDFMLLAARSIAHRKLRSWLTVIGVFIGITAVVALISIGLGLDRTIKDQVSKVFGVDTFMVLHQGAFGSRGPTGSPQGFSINLQSLRSIPGVKVAAAVREETGFVQGGTGSDGKSIQGFMPVMGLSPELATDFKSFLGNLELEPGGRLFTADDQKVVILGNSVAQRMNVGLGDSITVAGDTDEQLSMKVVGILAASSTGSEGGFGAGAGMGSTQDTVFVPYDTMSLLWKSTADVLVTLVKTDPGADVATVADRVQTKLRAEGSEITTVTYNDISNAIGSMTSTVSAFLAGIAGIALLVGGVGVMNTMFTSVLERTKEIGVMKAVGARNGHILSIFLIESGLMGLVGGIVGTLLGLGLSAVASAFIGRFFDVKMVVVASPTLIAVTLFGSFLLGAFAGLWPARRAAKLPPVDALRYE